MRVVTFNNRSCLSLRDADKKITPFQLLIVADSGHGKGTAGETIAERWKKATGGIVILLNDEKKEGEQTFVMYEPQDNYHLNKLKLDRINKSKYEAKLYHPYTHTISKKGYLPDINFFTLSLKDMTRDDWSILAESDAESETIKLLERVSEDLDRHSGLFNFLSNIERLTQGNNNKQHAIPDRKNWYLKSGGGTAKSVKQIGNLLSSFKKDYFLRKDSCPHILNWEKILLNPKPYHIFLTNWIRNPKVKNFLVEVLLGQAIREAQRLSDQGKLKKPILFLIPEILKVCPSEDKGSSLFLAKALRKSLISMRSQAGGISCIADTQIWSQTAPSVRASFNYTFYGRLNPEDASKIIKANSYTRTETDLLGDMKDDKNRGCYIWNGFESYGIYSIFMPSHRHKETGGKNNWIQTYKRHFSDKLKKYDDLVSEMRIEYNKEEDEARKNAKNWLKEMEEKEAKKEEKSETIKPEKQKTQKKDEKLYLKKRAYQLKQEGLSDRKIAIEMGISSKTIKKYYLEYMELLKIKKEVDLTEIYTKQ